MRKNLFVYLSLLALLTACSTRKNNFVSRNFHALTTKYNVRFNGEEAFKKGVLEVDQQYYDNFYKILPVEPFSVYTNESVDGEEPVVIGQASFDRAEEKATKAIQKHSMLIRRKERNTQIDESYLLLGKSRYYTGRFTPALEAFEYIIKNYPEASLIYETVIWRAKSNIHTGNINFSQRALERLIKAPKLSPKERQAAELALSMAYQIKQDSVVALKEHLKAAIDAYPRGQSAARARFVLGQLYQQEGDVEKANQYFGAVCKTSGALYPFKLRADVALRKNTPDTSYVASKKWLKKKLSEFRNRPYLAMLFYEQGIIEERFDSINGAKYSYTRSIQEAQADIFQKGQAYEKLGDIAFNKHLYQDAKSYYDSIINDFPKSKSERIKLLKRKSKGLEKIVVLEKRADENDSILHVASLDTISLNKYFEEYIERVKVNEERAREKKISAAKSKNTSNVFSDPSGWYFYNKDVVYNGSRKFKEVWGDKAKTKNWFLEAKDKSIDSDEDEEEESLVKKTDKKADEQTTGKKFNKYDIGFYTAKLNKEPAYLDSISRQRNLDYYELGNAYYDQLKESGLAAEKLEMLLTFTMEENLKIAAYYRLYKMYDEIEDVQKAQVYANLLNSQYPTSSFTQLINNNGQSEVDDETEEEVNKCYKNIYNLYLTHDNIKAKEELEKSMELYKHHTLAPKFSLLNAYVMGRLKGREEFNELLKNISLRFPNTEEAEKAKELLSK